MATQVQPPQIEIEVTMLFLNTLQEPYHDRLMPTATESFANMIKVGNLVDHAIKNGRIDVGESSSKPKRGSFAKKKEGETQALYQQNQPNQSRRYTSNQNHSNYQPHIQLRVIKRLMWFPNIHLPVPKHKLYKLTYLSQAVSQAL